VDHDRQLLTLQPGEQLVSRADPDFDVVAEKVIAPFGWSSLFLAVRRGEADAQGFSTFWTKYGLPERMPGTTCAELHAWGASFIAASPDGTYKITDSGTRLLIRRQARPAPTPPPEAAQFHNSVSSETPAQRFAG
jgi:hypothetical protein